MAIKKNQNNLKEENEHSKKNLNIPSDKKIEEHDDNEKKLDEIDSLGPEDDFKSFMTKDTPDNIKLAAFRKLWKSNPLFNFRDGLNDYDEDFKLLNSIGTDFMQAFYNINDTYNKKLKKVIYDKKEDTLKSNENYDQEYPEDEKHTNEEKNNKETNET